jgi:periplasmic protein CpxP/Spy
MSTKMSRFVAVAAASLAIGFGAYAAQPSDGQGGHGWHHHHGHFKEEMAKLHAELNLSPDQEKQWQAIADARKQNHDAMHAAHQQMHDQMKALMQQPILDMNALHDLRQKAEEQKHQMREQTSTAWLNFYNGLNDKQKTIVSTEMKKRWAMMEARHEKMREHWQHHKGAASAPAAN